MSATAVISAANRRRIQRALAWLSVRIAMLDRKIEKGESFTQVDSNTYLAWHNSLVRTLARLGIKRPDSSSTPPALTRGLAEMDDGAA